MGRSAEPVSKRLLVQKNKMKDGLAKSDMSCSGTPRNPAQAEAPGDPVGRSLAGLLLDVPPALAHTYRRGNRRPSP